MIPRLEGIREQLAAATKGPWFQGREDNHWENPTEVYSEREPSSTSKDICTAFYPEDATFIAAAPSNVAAILAALDAVLALADVWEEEFPHKAWKVRAVITTALEGTP